MVDNVNDWNDYLDNFVKTFEFELQKEVRETIARWQREGKIEDIIKSALNSRLDGYEERMKDVETNTNRGKDISNEIDSGLNSFHLSTGEYYAGNVILSPYKRIYGMG